MNETISSRLRDTGVVAIVRGIDVKSIQRLAHALYDGGVRLMEVTLNTPGALQAIESLVKEFGDTMSIGAGTVLTVDQGREAKAHGAQFFVTPHAGLDVIEFGVQAGLPVMAGAMTPTEIYAAYRAGASVIKVFPVSSLGPQYLKEVRGPLPDIPLMAVGGVTLDNAASFLDAGAVALGLGGGLVDKSSIERGDYDSITRKARAFVELYQSQVR